MSDNISRLPGFFLLISTQHTSSEEGSRFTRVCRRFLIDALLETGARVQVHDPEAMDEAQRIYGGQDDLALSGMKEAALKNADVLVVVTEWQQFKAPDFDVIKSVLNIPVIFVGRNLYGVMTIEKKWASHITALAGKHRPKYSHNL